MSVASHAETTESSLLQLLDRGASAKDIAAHLDGLPGGDRLAQVLGVTGRNVKKLYEAVPASEPLSLEEMIPANERGTLIYEGRNSLPMFTRFQKRLARLSGAVVGYNHQTMAFVTGPGYFVVKQPTGEGPHAKEILFDYTEQPPGQPEGWPPLKANEKGLSRLVYMDMHDYVRRVARGVYVGKAYKRGIDQDAYFSLTLGG